MHTHFRTFSRKFFEKNSPFTYSHCEKPNAHPISKNLSLHLFGIGKSKRTLFLRKNFEKYFLFGCGTAYFTYLKSPFTYLEFERQNATCFLEKTENFFEKAVYLKNIPSLVPTGRGHLGIVIPKKGKKICPPDMAGVFVFAWRRQHGLFIINR